jgi:RNA polymerase sigma-70 factor (ECF subfamily)
MRPGEDQTVSGGLDLPQEGEARLVVRAIHGDRAAQQELWKAQRRWVAAIVLAHKPRLVEVDDLMQDVALKLVDKIGTLRDPGAFRPWLRRIAINLCRGAARDLKPTLRLAVTERSDGGDEAWGGGSTSGLLGMPESREAQSDASVDRKEAAQRLLQQVLTLPTEYREPVLLRCLRSMTYRQIGDLLGLPVTTVETRLARARRMLREELGEQMTAEEGVRDEY